MGDGGGGNDGGGYSGGQGGGGGDDSGGSKYPWKDVDQHTFTPRAPWVGEEEPTFGAKLSHLKWDDPPELWIEAFDAPDAEYEEIARNSFKYRSYRHANDLDGPGKKAYADVVQEITVADVRYLDASGSRPMNLHAECWNLWHGLEGDECDVCDES